MTNHHSHGQKTPYESWGFVTDAFRPIPDQFRVLLSNLDGLKQATYTIWPLEDRSVAVVRPDTVLDAYLEASGTAQAMTIQVRQATADGTLRLYTVGHSGPTSGVPVVIPTGVGRATRVAENEVFSLDEAAAIFYTYYLTNAVAQPYQMRETNLADTVRVPIPWSHAESFNGGEFQYLTGDEEPVADHLRTILNQADGKRRFTYSIWRMTDPDDLRADGGDYIQAGGSAEALSIELGYPGPDGAQRLCTLGHPDRPVEPTTTVPISTDRAVRVFANEVFTADEAAVIFDEYYRTGRVSDTLTRRELDLAAVLSEPR